MTFPCRRRWAGPGRGRYTQGRRVPAATHRLATGRDELPVHFSISVGHRRVAPAAPDDAGLYTFYLGEAHRRRNRGDDAARATALYAEATTQPGAPPEAWREHGLALRQSGDRAAALTALRHYLALAPAAEDREFIGTYLAQENAQ